jgi:hypothetical protein
VWRAGPRLVPRQPTRGAMWRDLSRWITRGGPWPARVVRCGRFSAVNGTDNHPVSVGSCGDFFGRPDGSHLGRYSPSGPGQGNPGPPIPLELRGTTNNRKATGTRSTGGFQLTGQISGWAPEREHTAQNGNRKLLDVRWQVSMPRVAQGSAQVHCRSLSIRSKVSSNHVRKDQG